MRKRFTIYRPQAARLARIFPWVAAPFAGGLAAATAIGGTFAALQGDPILALIDAVCCAVNLYVVFFSGTRVGEQRALDAGVPHVIFEFGAPEGSNIDVTGPIAPTPPNRRPTHH